MWHRRLAWTVRVLAAFATFQMLAHAAGAGELSAEDIMGRSLDAFYYPGGDQRVKITMRLVNAEGSARDRQMELLRLNLPDGDQRYYIYFQAPSDIKGTSFLVWKYKNRDSDRWIYVPAIKLVRRIAADDKRSSFVGSDFTYEDVSGRQVEDETHRLLREENLSERPTYVVESRPKAAVEYARRISWIDRERWLPLKEEYYDDKSNLIRVFTADKVEQIGSFWTVVARTMKNVQTAHRTEVLYSDTAYKVGLDVDLFTERYLRDAPQQWLR